MAAPAELFRALGDETRLSIIEQVSQKQPCKIADVCLNMPISRQGVRKHVQVLVNAELLQLKPSGRDVLLELNPESLDQALEFLKQSELRWKNKLNALKKFVEES